MTVNGEKKAVFTITDLKVKKSFSKIKSKGVDNL